jgi:hypothetical protein
MACWGAQFEDLYEAPAGKFKAISAGDGAACGLREDGSVACTGYSKAPPPTGALVAVSAGSVVCGLRAEGTIDCAPPVELSGSFTSFDAGDGGDTVCGIRPDQTLDCTPPRREDWEEAPSGAFQQVACAGQFCCAIRAAGDIACWGFPQTSGERDAPSGAFVSLRAAWTDPCAAREDGTLACWGGWRISQRQRASIPSEPLLDYCVGSGFGCGIRLDGSLHCFGVANITELTPPK